MAEAIKKTGFWAYFNSAAHGDPSEEGSGGVLHLSETHYIKYKAALSRSSNNKAELMALKLIFSLAVENGVQKIQIMGDYGYYQLDNGDCCYGKFASETYL